RRVFRGWQRAFARLAAVERVPALYGFRLCDRVGDQRGGSVFARPARWNEHRTRVAGDRGARISRRYRRGSGAADIVEDPMATKAQTQTRTRRQTKDKSGEGEPRQQNGQAERIEWIVAAFSSVIVLALAGFILYEAITKTGSEPDIRFEFA